VLAPDVMKKTAINIKDEQRITMGDSLTANPITPYVSDDADMGTSSSAGHSDTFDENPSIRRHQREQRSDSYSSDGSASEYEDDLDNDEPPLSLEELLYSASSYHAIARPVCITMTLAALAAVYLNTEESLQAGEQQFQTAYNVWKIDESGSSAGKNLAVSIVNTLVMVLVIGTMTFGIVILYKYRCMKFLIGYMIFSSASLLGLLGDYMLSMAIEIYHIPIDVISYTILMYNFAVVGVIAIFYQKGVPNSITQTYLVCTSVILAWHLSHFDDWTAWTLLVMLALYDLCAVLTPCGPLKALVNLMQDKDAPEMPGLLYEAHLPAGTQRPGGRSRNVRSDDQGTSSTSLAESNREKQASTRRITETKDKAYPSSEERHNTHAESTVRSESPASPLTNGPRVFMPLAIAKVYRLPLVSTYGSSSRRSIKKSERRKRKDDSSSINESPLLADVSTEETVEEFYQQNFSVSELMSEVEAQLPRTGGTIEKISGNKYAVISKDGEIKRELLINKKGKVFDVTDDDESVESDYDDDGPSSIRLGLGDFIFYSVLVAKAAMYSFTTFAACMLVILAGLGATLIFLSVFHSALPALPISIFLGVIFYLLTRVLIEPWVEVVLTVPIYV